MIRIYMITNLITGKVYIGQTSASLATRLQNHFSRAKRNEGCRRLTASILRHGEIAFTIQELMSTDSDEEASLMEVAMIRLFGSCDSELGYNLAQGGKATRGHRWSDESRAKLSRSNLGNKRNLGRTLSAESRAKIAASLKGQPISAERRAKIRAKLIARNSGRMIA